MKYVGAIDQGTTSTRFMIFDEEGSVVASSQLEHRQIYPKPGWVEHDADEIWDNTCSVIRDCLRKAELNSSDLSAIGITNQRETIVPYDKATARPLYNAIVWQDLRGEAYISKLKEIIPEDELRRKTGLLYSPYFSASKIRWLLDNVPAIRKDADDGSIVFGTIDSYLTARLTSGKAIVTDVTNASRYMLMDIEKGEWDEKLLDITGKASGHHGNKALQSSINCLFFRRCLRLYRSIRSVRSGDSCCWNLRRSAGCSIRSGLL